MSIIASVVLEKKSCHYILLIVDYYLPVCGVALNRTTYDSVHIKGKPPRKKLTLWGTFYGKRQQAHKKV